MNIKLKRLANFFLDSDLKNIIFCEKMLVTLCFPLHSMDTEPDPESGSTDPNESGSESTSPKKTGFKLYWFLLAIVLMGVL